MKTAEVSSLGVDGISKNIVTLFSHDLDRMPVKQLYSGGSVFDVKGSAVENLTKKYLWATTDIQKMDHSARSDFIDECIRLESHFQFNFKENEPRSKRYIETARVITESVLGDLDEESWFLGCRNGPGATLGVRFVDTSWEAKFTYPISGTKQAIILFERYLRWDPQLEAAIYELNKLNTKPRYNVARGSRFHTVPKDSRKNRNIAIEPTLNMFFQQGLMAVMVDKLRIWGLCLDDLPDKHKNYALESSVTLQNATLDCKGASDSVHLRCVSLLVPPKWNGALNLIRCNEIEVRKGLWLELPMMSTMGNATTFPLETLVFYALTVAAVCESRHSEIRSESRLRSSLFSLFPSDDDLHSVSVFGDDIILPTSAAEEAIDALELFGFRINTEKSFFGTYPFRESCGGDYFDARDVRPFFLERPTNGQPKSVVSWLYHIWNSLSEKYASYFGENWVYVTQDTFSYLAKTISAYGNIRIVPDNMPSTAGIIDPDPRLLKNLSYLSDVRYFPLLIDRHGTIMFQYLSFEYIQKEKDKSNLYIGLYRALRGTRQVPKWIRKRKVGWWNESWSFGTLECVQAFIANGIPCPVHVLKTDQEYPIREHASGSYQHQLTKFARKVIR